MSGTADRRRGAAPHTEPTAREPLRERVARTLRLALGRDRNPLSRSVDRARARLAIALALLLAGALTTGWAVGIFALHTSQAEAARQRATRHRTTAVTTAPAYPPPSALPDGGTGTDIAPALWSDRDGHRRTGLLRAPLNAPAGIRVPTWINNSGDAVAAPNPPGMAVLDAVLGGGGALFASTTLAVAGTTFALTIVDHRADRAWEADWAAVEPEWSGRLEDEPPEEGEDEI